MASVSGMRARLRLFPLALRAATLALLALAWRQGGAWAWTLVPLAALALGRVPRRRLALELATLLALLGLATAEGPDPLALGAAAATLATLLLAPERGLLRLNGMDRYFVAQDYPGAAMNSHLWVELDRPLDRAALERAVLSLHEEVPMLRSFVREALLGVQRFAARAPFTPLAQLLRWRDRPVDEAYAQVLHEPFALARQAPFRVTHAPLAGGDGGALLLLSLHHAACDGEGLFIVLDWLLQRYDEAVRGSATAPLALTREGIRFRDAVRARGHGWGWLWRMIRRHLRPTGKVGVVNATLFDDEALASGEARHLVARLPAETWNRLGVAAAGGRTRNDLLLAAALRAADAHARDRAREDRPFRLMLPANLRQLLGLGPGLQNFLGALRCEFTPGEIRGDDLPDLVHARVREGRDLEEAAETPVNLGVLSLLMPPWLMRRALRSLDADTASSFFSMLFSHLRSPPIREVTGVTVRSVSGRGSLTRRPGFGVALARDQGGLSVTIEYLYPLVRDQSAREFFDRFAGEVAKLVGSHADDHPRK